MHARVTTFRGASDIETVLTFLRDHAMPQMQQQQGFRGLSAAGDRAGGVLRVLSRWDNLANLEASEEVAERLRGDAAGLVGGEIDIERYEQAVWKATAARATPGAVLHVLNITIDSNRIDGDIDFLRQTLGADIGDQPGFLSVGHLINRTTGGGAVSSVWEDQDSLAASLTQSAGRDAMARDRGIELGAPRVLEVLFFAL
jgi:heme-degrading monooxygenase HmoA